MTVLYVLLAIIVILGIPFIRFAIRGAELATNRFACPNCGHHFYAKWYQLILAGGAIYAFHYANVRCPKCKTKDSCSVIK